MCVGGGSVSFGEEHRSRSLCGGRYGVLDGVFVVQSIGVVGSKDGIISILIRLKLSKEKNIRQGNLVASMTSLFGYLGGYAYENKKGKGES